MTLEQYVDKLLAAVPSGKAARDVTVEVCAGGEYLAVTGVVMRPEAGAITILTEGTKP